MMHEGVSTPVHRLAYQIHVGPIPEDLHVLHRCDVPSCVNPEHLFLGTNADNVADKMAKGRHVAKPGSLNGNSVLVESQVTDIAAHILKAEETFKRIAVKFGVSKSLITSINLGRSWGQVTGASPGNPLRTGRVMVCH